MLPYTRARLREIVETLRVDVLQLPGRRPPGLGHNALAGVIYSLSFAAVLFQVATGFALYAPMSESPFPALFAWIVPLFGGDAWVRVWHHATLWFFVLFFIVHVYLVGYHDQVERRGIVSSIVSGWKFVERDESDAPGESE
jgi:Ni/Fe-hydrogenase 1 B-type cytochrome subunit